MCDCERALELISLDLDGALTPQERQELEAHLSACPDCAALARELGELHQSMRSLEEDVPEGFHQAVMDRVHAEKVLPLPRKRSGSVSWRRWASLAAVFAVVLVGAGSLGKSWTGGSSGTAVTAGGADQAMVSQEAALPQETPAGGAPELSLYGVQGESAPTTREAEEKVSMNAEAYTASESPLPTVGPALMEAAPTDAGLTEEQRDALSASCASWLQSSGLDQAEAIDTSLLTVEAVTQEDLEAAVCSGEDQRALLDLNDYRVTLGDPSGSAYALLLCDSDTLEVLGYLPIE